MWYAYRTAPQRERHAYEAVIGAGITALHPIERLEVRRRSPRHRSKITTVITKPLLPGYGLAMHDGLPDWWHRMARLTMYGGPQTGQVSVVKSFVGTEGVPVEIPQQAIDHLAELSGRLQEIRKAPALRAGSKAQIIAGPMLGEQVRVEQVRGNNARVLLGLMRLSCVVPIHNLEAA